MILNKRISQSLLACLIFSATAFAQKKNGSENIGEISITGKFIPAGPISQ
jgi:hypothetical protein